MPTGTLVRTPTSLSRNNKVKTNLRGINAASPVDYANEKFSLSATNLVQVSSAIPTGEGAWANTIKYAYEAQTEATATYIQYPTVISSASDFTIFLRFYIKEITGLASTFETLFFSGFVDFINYDYNGYIINYNRVNNILTFDLLNGGSVQLSTLTFNTNEWYHYGMKIRTVTGGTKIKVWENGVSTGAESEFGISLAPPTGSTSLFSANQPGFGDYFYGGITDFTFLEGNDITDDQMPAFASAPFI
jgi:hypothetical protein